MAKVSKITSLLAVLAFFTALISLKSVEATRAKWTYYYIAIEAEESGSGSKSTWLRTCKGKPIKQVTRYYAERVHMEGTGRLENGKMINLGDCLSKCNLKSGQFDCFEEIDGSKFLWGIGSEDNNIYPYVSIASNKLKYGTTVEV